MGHSLCATANRICSLKDVRYFRCPAVEEIVTQGRVQLCGEPNLQELSPNQIAPFHGKRKKTNEYE